MVRCPFCDFENEDGAMFCEQCKLDLNAPPDDDDEESAPLSRARETMKVQGGAGVAAPSPPAWRAASDDAALPPNAQPMLIVRRGNKIHRQYPIYEGHNFIGRIDEKPVDIDLEGQEPPDRVLASRQHAVITFEDGKLVIEDLNSTNGTFVNRTRVQPGHKRPLQAGDLVQIGAVQLQLKV